MAVTIKGLDRLTTQLRQFTEKMPVAVAFGNYEGLQDMMILAKQKAPEESGDLKKSGYVTPPEVRSGAEIRIEAGFGGQRAGAYVIRQHEDMSLKHPNGGEAKFLERAMDEKRDDIRKAVEKHLNHFIKTGQTRPVAKKVPAHPDEA